MFFSVSWLAFPLPFYVVYVPLSALAGMPQTLGRSVIIMGAGQERGYNHFRGSWMIITRKCRWQLGWMPIIRLIIATSKR
jgi:hypothetical protein